jgi:hypothetical protein
MRILILLFSSLPSNKKQIFKINFFCILPFDGTFTSFFKEKKSKRGHKPMVFLLFLLMIEGSGSIPLTRIRIQEAQKHVDPVDPDLDPDPQHCFT